MKELKAIVKKNNLGKVSKLKKVQLLGLISNCPECKTILNGLTMVVRIRKPPSAKQLAARAKFSLMVKAKGRKLLPVANEAKKKAEKLLKDALQQPQKVIEPIKNIIQQPQKVIQPIKEKVIEAKKEVKELVKIVKKKVPKKDFLDNIFGASLFNLKTEMTNVIEELNEDLLDKFLGLSKVNKTKMLMKRFNKSSSITKLIKRLN